MGSFPEAGLKPLSLDQRRQLGEFELSGPEEGVLTFV